MRTIRQREGEKYSRERGERQKGRVEQQRAMWLREKRAKDEYIFVNRMWSVPWFFLVMSGGLYGLCFLLLSPRHVKGLEVTVMDVGQGGGMLMRTGNYTVLIDGGSNNDKSLGNRTMEPCLKSMRVAIIDSVVISHGNSDHIGEILCLLEESRDIKVRDLILPPPGKEQKVYEQLEQAVELGGGRVHCIGPGERIQAGNLRMTRLYAGGRHIKMDDYNAHSLIICTDYGDFYMLFIGDMETGQERELLEAAQVGGSLQQEHLSHVQVLKTAHYGSGTSTGEGFSEYLGPGSAVISYGRSNSYGHPSKEVIDRMKNRRTPVMETGIGSAVILWTGGKELICSYFPQQQAVTLPDASNQFQQSVTPNDDVLPCGFEVTRVPGISRIPVISGRSRKSINLVIRVPTGDAVHIVDISVIRAYKIVVSFIILVCHLFGVMVLAADIGPSELLTGAMMDPVVSLPSGCDYGAKIGHILRSPLTDQVFEIVQSHEASADTTMVDERYPSVIIKLPSHILYLRYSLVVKVYYKFML